MEKVMGEQHLCVLSQDQNSAELWYVKFIRSMRGYDECIKLLKSHSVWVPSGGQDSSETLWLSLSDIYKTCSFSVVQAFDTCMISVLIKALKPRNLLTLQDLQVSLLMTTHSHFATGYCTITAVAWNYSLIPVLLSTNQFSSLRIHHSFSTSLNILI